MKSYVDEFIDRILVNNRTKWWKGLQSETNNNKGLCLKSTLDHELIEIPGYRKDDRQLFFFSTDKKSTIDGRYKSLGVEEKFNPLDLKEHLIDGSIHRGIVWVFGNPQNVPQPVESISLYVVKDNSIPIISEVVDLYFPILFSLLKIGLQIVFVDGLTGEFWRLDNKKLHNPLPKWLASKKSPDVWDLQLDVVTEKNCNALSVINNRRELSRRVKTKKILPGFGKKGEYVEVEIDTFSKAAIIEYGNEWRLIELGLILRSAGYDAVKVIYNKEKHKNSTNRIKDKVDAGKGVEKRVADEMLLRFSVVIDWYPNLLI